MELDRAVSLADHINEHSSRFRATVLDFRDKGVVIVSETGEDGTRHVHREAIADTDVYLKRASEGSLQGDEGHELDEEYRDLLQQWRSACPVI